MSKPITKMNPHDCTESQEPVFLEWDYHEGEFGDLVYRMASAKCPHCGTRYLRILGFVKNEKRGFDVTAPLAV